MSSARPLAVHLAASSDEELDALLRARGARADATWNDFFDAAEWLLDPGSVERALSTLTRSEAATLLSVAAGEGAGPHRSALVALALLDADGRVPAAVASVMSARAAVTATTGAPPPPAADAESARAAERASATVSGIADLLLTARRTPLTLVASGALSAGERRRLSDAGLEGEIVDELRALAGMAGLAVSDERVLLLTRAADTWLSASFAQRWSTLVSAFRDTLPRGIRDGDGWLPLADWDGAHPWDSAWPARSTDLRAQALLLGLLTPAGTEPVWTTAVREGRPVDASSLGALLPSEVDRVFLQNDLTAIAPGPLQPALDNRLRAMSEHDSAQASSYRFTAESIAHALVEGETEQSITAFLAGVSLTGIPQPLTYLIAQAASRHGLVRVALYDGGGTRVTSADAALLAAIEVDRGLRPLGLMREDDALITRVGAETVAWALSDGRYPATLVDADGNPVPAHRRRPVSGAGAGTVEVSYAPLIARLREHQRTDSDAAWLDRELDAAVRNRAVLRVEVAMPDGSSRELLLEASGLGGGRLRGRDRAADVERTLPVRSILSVQIVTD